MPVRTVIRGWLPPTTHASVPYYIGSIYDTSLSIGCGLPKKYPPRAWIGDSNKRLPIGCQTTSLFPIVFSVNVFPKSSIIMGMTTRSSIICAIHSFVWRNLMRRWNSVRHISLSSVHNCRSRNWFCRIISVSDRIKIYCKLNGIHIILQTYSKVEGADDGC